MDGAGAWIIPLFILATALGLIVWHVRQWRRVREEDLAQEDADFHWRQCRRRIQCSTMLAILAVGMMVGPWLPWLMAQIILGVLIILLLVWLCLLALADYFLTRHYYERLHSECLIEQAKLEIEARRLRGLAGNGRPSAAAQEPEDESPD